MWAWTAAPWDDLLKALRGRKWSPLCSCEDGQSCGPAGRHGTRCPSTRLSPPNAHGGFRSQNLLDGGVWRCCWRLTWSSLVLTANSVHYLQMIDNMTGRQNQSWCPVLMRLMGSTKRVMTGWRGESGVAPQRRPKKNSWSAGCKTVGMVSAGEESITK